MPLRFCISLLDVTVPTDTESGHNEASAAFNTVLLGRRD